jgi:hypothetical protein
MLNSVDDIIKALGGPTATAAILGVYPSALSNWKDRGGIPLSNFLLLEKALVARGKRKPSRKLLKVPVSKNGRRRHAVAGPDLD